MRVAIVHDWLTGMRGGEKVLEVFCEIYPEADIFSLVYIPDKISETIKKHKITTSFINSLPWAWKRHQLYLPLFPMAIELFDLADYDLIISTSHCVAKGVITRATSLNVCYCHTPMRYAWDFQGVYRREARPQWLVGTIFALTLEYLRRWDVASAGRPNHYIANSHNVRRRIERYYGKEADVVHPPVDDVFFVPSNDEPKDYWLMLSAMVPYKDLDGAIEAFNQSGRKLHVVGAGAQRSRLEAMACDNVTFFGWLTNEEVREQLQNSRGLIFPGEEDFGITPLEANACGRPVVALRKGGVLESQVEDKTACFFDELTPELLNEAVTKAEAKEWDSKAIREHAETFSRKRFRSQLEEKIAQYDEAFKKWKSVIA